MKKIFNVFILLLIGITLVSCQNRYQYIDGKINITATTNVMANLAEEIGGEKVNVYALMGQVLILINTSQDLVTIPHLSKLISY